MGGPDWAGSASIRPNSSESSPRISSASSLPEIVPLARPTPLLTTLVDAGAELTEDGLAVAAEAEGAPECSKGTSDSTGHRRSKALRWVLAAHRLRPTKSLRREKLKMLRTTIRCGAS